MNLRQLSTKSATSGEDVVGANPDLPTDKQGALGQILKPLQASWKVGPSVSPSYRFCADQKIMIQGKELCQHSVWGRSA